MLDLAGLLLALVTFGPVAGALLAFAAVAAQEANVVTIDNFTFTSPELTWKRPAVIAHTHTAACGSGCAALGLYPCRYIASACSAPRPSVMK